MRAFETFWINKLFVSCLEVTREFDLVDTEGTDDAGVGSRPVPLVFESIELCSYRSQVEKHVVTCIIAVLKQLEELVRVVLERLCVLDHLVRDVVLLCNLRRNWDSGMDESSGRPRSLSRRVFRDSDLDDPVYIRVSTRCFEVKDDEWPLEV